MNIPRYGGERSHRPVVWNTALGLSLLVAACGGGGGGTHSLEPVVLSGTAATGAPMAGATIVVKDARGETVQRCGATPDCLADDRGVFRIELAEGATAPYVLEAKLRDRTEVSMTTATRDATVNIHPISSLIAAQLAGGDPSTLEPSAISNDKLAIAKDAVLAALKPLLDAVGSTVDPLTDTFATNGTGLDKALDVLGPLDVQRKADGSVKVVANIKLNGDDAQPATLTITANAPVQVSGMANVTPAALPRDGVTVQLADLAHALGACYNLPYTERVDTSTSPATLKAAACRSLFVDADPGSYLHNGASIGPSGAFSGMFANRETSGPNGSRNLLTFDNPVYEFTRGGANAGDVVATLHWSSLTGQEDWFQVVVRPQNGQLRLVGNQYAYSANVRPQSQRRIFLQKDSGAMSYEATGFNVNVVNSLNGQGQPLFDRVMVTAPSGRTLVLRPTPGSASLRIEQPTASGPVLSKSSVIWLQWAFVGSNNRVGATTGKDIAELQSGSVYARTPQGALAPWSDADIAAIPAQSKWRYDFYLASNPAGAPVTQWHTAMSRPETLAELRSKPFVSLTPAGEAILRTAIDDAIGAMPMAGRRLSLQPADGGAAWQVPSGAVAPTRIGFSGDHYTLFPDINNGRVSFTDELALSSTARTVTLPCTKDSANDGHCATANDGTSTGLYAPYTVGTDVWLSSYSSTGLNRQIMYSLYKRVP